MPAQQTPHFRQTNVGTGLFVSLITNKNKITGVHRKCIDKAGNIVERDTVLKIHSKQIAIAKSKAYICALYFRVSYTLNTGIIPTKN